MAGFAIIENGVVVNMAVASPEFAASQGWIAVPDGVGIGWSYDGQTFIVPPPPAEPTPAPVPTKEQLLAQLQALQAQINALE